MQLSVAIALAGDSPRDVRRRSTIVGAIAFLTLIDLFGTQALMPRLIALYGTDAATMGFAVNASTIGMAVAGLAVAWFSDRIDRKRGLWVSLALLAIPTTLLAFAGDTTTFLLLRIAQGALMAAAFTLTLTYLSEACTKTAAASAMAAYITGNVASNLFGRLMAASFADFVGVAGSFLAFAVLNLLGATIAYRYIGASRLPEPAHRRSPLKAWREHLADPKLCAAFGLGFFILFIFVGVFTYVNLRLVTPEIGLDPAWLGLVYVVFFPALVTTPYSARLARHYGARWVFWGASGVAAGGLLLSLTANLWAILAGLVLVGVGTFVAQAAATGYVGRTARRDHAAANGLYLTSYYVGGLAGALVLGQTYDAAGWSWTVAALLIALIFAALLATAMTEPIE
ncbi:MAG: MFS transporter [Pseudomonadota bacterium]